MGFIVKVIGLDMFISNIHKEHYLFFNNFSLTPATILHYYDSKLKIMIYNIIDKHNGRFKMIYDITRESKRRRRIDKKFTRQWGSINNKQTSSGSKYLQKWF